MITDKYLDIATDLKDKYDVKCYKKNDKDKLYSFIFNVGDTFIYTDFGVDRFIGRTHKLYTKELRLVKKHLRNICELIEKPEWIKY